MLLRRAATFCALLICLAQLGLAPAAAPRQRYIVALQPGADMAPIAARYDLRIRYHYQHALSGFSADVPATALRALAADPAVATLAPVVSGELLGNAATSQLASSRAAGQLVPAGIRRVGADRSPIARIDGVDTPLDVDVAVVDSGIDGAQPDLNVAGSVACAGGSLDERAPAEDLTGHGTAVAQVLAARDNGTGIVGVAPGARLWSIRVAQRGAGGRVSYGIDDLICGLDWVAAHADTIEVANVSLGSYATGPDRGTCGAADIDSAALLHQAVCAAVQSGVTVVVAAGEPRAGVPRTDAANIVPARFDEAITVAAMADFDGRAGGSSRRAPCVTGDRDDTFGDDSNYGAAVDLVAPGVCVATSVATYWSGTSFAAPHVAGAAALYKLLRPDARPAEVKTALLAAAERGWNTAATQARPHGDDPDGLSDPLVNVAALAPVVASQRAPHREARAP